MPRGGKNFIDLTGQTFGELTVISRLENNKHGRTRWKCKCSCGETHPANGSDLRNGHTTTCGHVSTHCKWGHLRTSDNVYPNGTCKECQKVRRAIPEIHEKILIDHRAHYARNSKRISKTTRKRTADLKVEVLTHYGPNGMLGCCWEECSVVDPDMLSLDHVNNDGAEHRRKVGKNKTGEKMYRLVKQDGFPEGFQTLCMNHQTKKKLLNVRSRYE